MLRRQPVVTGLGLITAAGCGTPAVWDALRAGRSGLGPLTLFESPRHGRHLVGQVRAEVDRLAGTVRGSRSDKLAWIALKEALAHAGLLEQRAAIPANRIGVLLGSTVAGMLGTEGLLQRRLREQHPGFGALRFHECASATDLCARAAGARGPSATFSTACSAGAMAIAAAAELIENGELDVALAGGADSLSRLTLNGFGSLLLLDPNGCRPFDASRAGISLGEGAGFLVLEAEETARARGARILAKLAGWGASCDANHATAPHPDGDGALAAMQLALDRGGLGPTEIDYVSAHGTGTPDNDAMEGRALQRLFGDKVPPFASVKRFFGHTLAASGAIKAVLCVKALEDQATPPNPGFANTDPRIGLEPVTSFQERQLRHVLSNSFGFGGNNVALVFSHPDAAENSHPPAIHADSPRKPVRLAVLGFGTTSAAGQNMSEIQVAFRAGGPRPSWFETGGLLPAARVPAYRCPDPASAGLIAPARRRKLGHLQQMALTAAHRALATGEIKDVAPERVCTAMGTGLGCLGDTAAFVENLLVNEERAPLPTRFTNSVHNACASQLAIEFGLRGLNSTSTHREISFEVALWHCAMELAAGRADAAVAGAADELSPYVLAAGARWGWWNEHTQPVRPFARTLVDSERPLPGESATVFLLALAGHGHGRALAQVSAIRFGRWMPRADGRPDAIAQAGWIRESLVREGHSVGEVDCCLVGANGWLWLDDAYREVVHEHSALAGRPIACATYKQACGEHHAASAFGLLTAIGLVRGEIELRDCVPDHEPASESRAAPRSVLVYTLSPAGGCAMCLVCA